MKTWRFIFMALLAGTVAFTSCESDDETTPGPSITTESGLTSQELDLFNAPSIDFSFTANIVAEGKLDDLKVTVYKKNGGSLGSARPISVDSKLYSGKTAYAYTYAETITEANFTDAEALVVEIIATDDNELTGKFEFTITKKVFTPLATEKNGYINHISGTGKGAWDLLNDVEVGLAGDKAAKYLISSETDATKFTGTWSSAVASYHNTAGELLTTEGNGTLFVKVTEFDYSNATKEAAVEAFEAGNASTKVATPAVDDIYIAKKGEEIYVIKITAKSETGVQTGAKAEGYITFSYKK